MKRGINLFQPEFKLDIPQGNHNPQNPTQIHQIQQKQTVTSKRPQKSHKNRSHTKQKATHSTTQIQHNPIIKW